MAFLFKRELIPPLPSFQAFRLGLALALLVLLVLRASDSDGNDTTSLQMAGGGTSQPRQPHGPIAHKKSLSVGLHIIASVSLENPDKSIFNAYGCGSNAPAFNHHLLFP